MAIKFGAENLNKHRELAESVKNGLDRNGAVISEKESHGTYYENLPEGLTKKQVEDLSKYNVHYIAAAHLAVGEMAADAFVEDKNLDRVTASMGYFGKNDSIDMTVDRSKTYQNRLTDGDDKEVTKHLVVKTQITTASGKGYGVKAIRDSMSQEFEGMFKK